MAGVLRAVLQASTFGALPTLVLCATVASNAAASPTSCSCGIPSEVLSPSLERPVPVDARIRIRHPAGAKSGGFLLRLHRGGEIATTVQRTLGGPDDPVEVVELVPSAPLPVGARFEVGEKHPDRRPSLLVFATFVTQAKATTDALAPVVDTPGKLVAFPLPATPIDSCGQRPPRLQLHGLRAHDPGRTEAALLVAFWRADASGVIDEKKPPIVFATLGDPIDFSGREMCGQAAFVLPERGPAEIGWAIVDERGNRSSLRREKIVLP